MKQGNVNRAISVSKVQLASSKKSVLLANTVLLAPMFPSLAQLAPFLTLLACGKLNSVKIVRLGHTVLSKEEPTLLENAQKGIIVLLGLK